MANKKKNPEVAPTSEQRSRAASSSRKKQRKTYVSKTVKIVLVVIGVLAMLLSVSAMACSGLMSQTESASSGYKLTGGVAATINGTNLTEDTVTKQIMSMRTSYGYTKDKDWAQYLVDNDLTPKKYRKQLIDSYTADSDSAGAEGKQRDGVGRRGREGLEGRVQERGRCQDF